MSLGGSSQESCASLSSARFRVNGISLVRCGDADGAGELLGRTSGSMDGTTSSLAEVCKGTSFLLRGLCLGIFVNGGPTLREIDGSRHPGGHFDEKTRLGLGFLKKISSPALRATRSSSRALRAGLAMISFSSLSSKPRAEDGVAGGSNGTAEFGLVPGVCSTEESRSVVDGNAVDSVSPE